jgi:hypothetical protein
VLALNPIPEVDLDFDEAVKQFNDFMTEKARKDANDRRAMVKYSSGFGDFVLATLLSSEQSKEGAAKKLKQFLCSIMKKRVKVEVDTEKNKIITVERREELHPFSYLISNLLGCNQFKEL